MGENSKDTCEREKCFVIMPISDQGDYPSGHFTKVYEQIFQPAIEKAGYEAYRVDKDKICDSIIDKIFRAAQDCPMAICDLSNRNPNVLYELGLRQAYDRPVVLVQDEKTERIFDVSGINTITYNSGRQYEYVIEARDKITEAIISTREGKRNSVVKVIQAKAASFSCDSMSKDDRIEILLSSILGDIQDLKEDRSQTYHSISKNDEEFYLKFKDYFSQNTCEYVIELKQGVTNKTISELFSDLKRKGLEVDYIRKGQKLYIYFKSVSPKDVYILTSNLSEIANIAEFLKN